MSSFTKSLRRWYRSGSRAATCRTRRVARLNVESLEDRTTPTSAHLIADIAPGLLGSDGSSFVRAGDHVYFVANSGNGFQVYETDINGNSAAPIPNLPAFQLRPDQLTAVGNAVYFCTHPNTPYYFPSDLYRYDGTLLTQIDVSGTGLSDPRALTSAGNSLYFEGTDDQQHTRLYRHDGTALSVIGVGGGFNLEFIDSLTPMGNSLFFTALDYSLGRELFVFDGTTLSMIDVNPWPAPYGSYPERLTPVGNSLYFIGQINTINYYTTEQWLWRYDSTTGTVSGIPSISTLSETAVVGDVLYYVPFGGNIDYEVYRFDGFTNTRIDINSAGSSNPTKLKAVGGTVYCVATDAGGDRDLFRIDGITATKIDVNPNGPAEANDMTAVGGTLYFHSSGSDNQDELYRYVGTTLTKIDVNPNAGLGSSPQYLTAVGHSLYFAANGVGGDRELFQYNDDTLTLTKIDINSTSTLGGQSYPYNLTAIGDKLVCTADDGAHGIEPWWVGEINHSPVANPGGPYVIAEGSAFTLNGGASYDPDSNAGDRIVKYEWDLNYGDGNPFSADRVGAAPLLAMPAYPDNFGPRTIALRVTDTYGATSVIATTTLTVLNALPTVVVTTDPGTANEGQARQFHAQVTDPGTLDTHTYVWSFGDGSPAFTGPTTVTHVFADNGTYTVICTATDDDGGSGQGTLDVSVANVVPTWAVPINQAAVPGVPKQFDLGTFSDPGFDYAPAGTREDFRAEVNWGDGPGYESATVSETAGHAGALTTGAIQAGHAYAGSGDFRVTVRLRDDDMAADWLYSSFLVTVTPINLPPQVDVIGPATVGFGHTWNGVLRFSDDAASAPWEAMVAYGDGTAETLQFSVSEADGIYERPLAHRFGVDGNLVIRLTVTDAQGLAGTDTQPVTVAPPAFRTAFADAGDMVVIGTQGGDIIQVNGLYPARTTATVNGRPVPGNFKLDARDSRVVVYALGGSDVVSVYGNVASEVFGGDGNDVLTGGSREALLRGEFGDDVLIGGAGNDLLIGGWGRDTVLGGAGHDVVVGGHSNATWEQGTAARLSWLTVQDAAALAAMLQISDPGEASQQDMLGGGTGSDAFLYRGHPNFVDILMDFRDREDRKYSI